VPAREGRKALAACLSSSIPPADERSARRLAGSTGLEPAASAVTGQRSNQLNYDPNLPVTTRHAQVVPGPSTSEWWAVQGSNL